MKLLSRQVVTSGSWLLADRIVQVLAGGLLGILKARILGPEDFGVYSYVIAVTAVAFVCCNLSLESMVVRDLVKDRKRAPVTLASCLAIQLCLGLLIPVAYLWTLSWVKPDDSRLLLVCSIYAMWLPFSVRWIFIYWFQSQVQGQYIFLCTTLAYLLSSALQCWVLLTYPSVEAVMSIMAVERAAPAFLLMLFFAWCGPTVNFSHISFSRIRELIWEALPLAISMLSILLAWKIDQIMLGSMSGLQAVGIYAVCAMLVQMLASLLAVAIRTVYPVLVESMPQSPGVPHPGYQRLYNVFTTTTVLIAIFVSLVSEFAVEVIFGSSYESSAQVLTIYIWSLVFWSLGAASGSWLVAQRLGHLVLYRSIGGMFINIGMNLLLIPLMGINGAAMATLTSLCITYLFMDMLGSHTRVAFVQKIKALAFLWVWGGLMRRDARTT